MFTNRFSDAGTKRLDFGANSGRMEWVFGGVLTLIIVTALALTVWQLFFREQTPASTGEAEVHLQCVKCKAVTVLKFKDMTDDEKRILTMPPMPGMMPGQTPHIKCKVSGCGGDLVKMDKCPMCKEWYPSPNQMMMGNTPLICPLCHKDIRAYWEEQRAKSESGK